MRLKINFFNRSTLIVAKELLGKYLVRKIDGKLVRAKIAETEAYCGQKDLANHASKGVTPRTKIMFGPPGHAYVYLIYGMYYCFNIVTEKEGYPAAVLIRSAEFSIYNPAKDPRGPAGPFSGFQFSNKSQIINSKIKNTKLNGPGILCRELKIDKKFNGVNLCKSNEIWIEDFKEKPAKIKKGKRVGIEYAGKWKDKFWRFWVD